MLSDYPRNLYFVSNCIGIYIYIIAVLSRSKEEGIGMEDLDKLQMELEMLLSHVVLRQRTLHSEISQISVEETKAKRTSLAVAKSVSEVDFDLFIGKERYWM